MSPNTTPMHARVAGAHACVGNMRTEVPVLAAMPCAMARSSPLVASSHCLPQGSRLRRLSRTTGRLQQGFAPGEMGFREWFAQQQCQTAHVRFGSKADIAAPPTNVR